MPQRRPLLRPAPILKQDSADSCPSPALLAADPAAEPLPFTSCTSIYSTRVHFPPTPKLTSACITYPSHAYDRAPIVVGPNTCALPRRGEREYEGRQHDGRSHRHDREHEYERAMAMAGGYFAAAPLASSAFPGFELGPPSLVASTNSSSESDDSDTSIMTPPTLDLHPFHGHGHAHHQHRPAAAFAQHPSSTPPPPLSRAHLDFLPHPPSPPAPGKEKRRRSATPCARGRRPTVKPIAAFGEPFDDGCLGGF